MILLMVAVRRLPEHFTHLSQIVSFETFPQQRNDNRPDNPLHICTRTPMCLCVGVCVKLCMNAFYIVSHHE